MTCLIRCLVSGCLTPDVENHLEDTTPCRFHLCENGTQSWSKVTSPFSFARALDLLGIWLKEKQMTQFDSMSL